MSRQGDACRALGDSIDVAETIIFQNVIKSINEGKLLLDEVQLRTLKQDVRSALSTAKNRGIDQVIKAVQE